MTDLELVLAVLGTFSAILAVIVGLLTLGVSHHLLEMKSGIKMRGNFSETSSVTCSDTYVSSIDLENLKDRTIAIYKIYLLLNRGLYLEVDDFSEKPLILKPFEVFHKRYDPIDHYAVSLRRINIDKFLFANKKRPKILLVTSEGKYVVRRPLRIWSPLPLFFHNHLTAIIRPYRTEVGGIAYGEASKYVVILKNNDGTSHTIPLYSDSFRKPIFTEFRLTEKSLESKLSLEIFLNKKIQDGLLEVDQVIIHDLESWRAGRLINAKAPPLLAPTYNWFTYNVAGPVVTKWGNLKRKHQNKRNREKGN